MKIDNRMIFQDLSEHIPSGGKICVALSGGADSVCLLHLLHAFANEHPLILSAVHVNHHLRGEESDRDAAFCRRLCEEWQVPLTVIDVYVKDEIAQGESVETAARRLRYGAFETVEADYIATAHNADDSLETFLINFSRGSGLRGLCGIPAVRDRFIRPLLVLAKQTILDYCAEHHLPFVEDSTNRSDDYTRNRIRHHIVPELEKINPSIHAVASRNFELLKMDNDFIEHEVQHLYGQAVKEEAGLDAAILANAHTAIALRVLQCYCYAVTHRYPDALHLKEMLALCQTGRGETGLFEHYRAKVQKGVFWIDLQEEILFSTETEVVSIENYKNQRKIHNLLFKNAIDYDKIIGKFEIRTRLPADRMRPVGRGVTKPLRRLQAEAEIPREQRPNAPVAADEAGLIWGYQVGASERVQIDANTKNVLIFQVYQVKNRGQ